MKTTKRIFSILLTLCMLVGTLGVLPITAFAANAATIEQNGAPYRTSDTDAEVGFCSTSGDFSIDWQYYYIVSEQSTALTADEIKSDGSVVDFDENSGVGIIFLTDLTAGMKYIHIVLAQKADATQISNVLTLEIPAFVKLTLTPSAVSGEYNESTNTLTVEGGGEITFTLNASGYVHCDNDETIRPTPTNGEYENATEWTVNLPNENKTYTFYYALAGQTAECTVVVEEKTTYTLTLVMGNETIGGDIATLETKQYDFDPGTIVDLTDYWTSAMEYTVNGQTYYFSEFWEHKTGGNTVRSVTISADLTVYAGWVKRKQITITFNPNGGSLPYEKVREFSDSFSKMNEWHIPTRDGYTFLGWSVWPEGPADRPDRIVKNDCTLYAIWAEGIVIKGYEDAVLVDKNGTIEKVEDGYTAIFNDSKVDMNNSAWQSLIDQLQDGEQLKIATEKIDVTELADDEVLFDSGVLTGSVIFTEQELLDLKVIEEDNDDITWNELKYLYHYMTITELKSLGWFIEDFLYNIDPQVLVWLAEMIERDTIKPLNMQELMDMADLTDEQWELLADEDLNDPTIGELRQAGLTVEQMRKLYGEVGNLILGLNDSDKLRKCNELLDWLDEAIAVKEWEADMSQTQPSWAYAAKETVIGAVNINFDAVKVNATTGAVSESRSITANGELAYTIAVSPTFDLSKGTVRAYKVADDGSLSLRKVVVNTDGTVTIQSDSNSTYIITYEEHTHSFEWVIDKEATETEDGIKHEECACGAKQNENTVIPKTGTTEPNGLSTGAIVAIVIACVVVLAGGGFALYWFVIKKKKGVTP